MGEPVDVAAAPTVVDSGQGTVQLVPPPAPSDERYQQVGTLGKGGVGVVSLHLDRRIGRRVAFKQLRPTLARDEQTRARFLREAQVQGQLEHPSVVPVYDLGVDAEGLPFFTMKTIQGVTLRQILEELKQGDGVAQKKYTRHRMLSAFASVCLTIDYAHQRGILHRDLKPENLMLGDFGEVYVLDWGLAKIRGTPDDPALGTLLPTDTPPSPAVTNVGAFLGTPGYMAPEQLHDASGVTEAADIYALGAILFEILALEPLHPRGSALELLASNKSPVEARPSVRTPARDAGPELDKLCVAATAVDPAQRMKSARQMNDALQSYLEGERDLEVRKAKAEAHADAAAAATQRVGAGGEAGHEARREAMREIGRALALDPGNARAVTTMVDLLSHAPRETPWEVEFEIEKAFRRDGRWIGSVGARIYPGVVTFLPVLAWMGVRQWPVVGTFFALLAVCAVLSVLVSRSKVPPLSAIMASMVASSAAFAVCSRFGSPVILAPTALAVNAAGYAIFLKPQHRWYVALVSCLAFAVPMGLELAGVLSPTLTFDGGNVVVVSRALEMPRLPTLALVSIGSLAAILISVFVVGHIRDRLSEAERRMYLYTWHLREFVPPEARQASDPVD
jgi:tRNA A-37 threonylcarbamoyl transferase component Bud32